GRVSDTIRIRIRILEDDFEVEPGDSILRALQQYGVERDLPAYGFTRFCWNAKCRQCVLVFSCRGQHQRDFACQTEVREGIEIHTLPRVLMWKNKLAVRSGR